MLIDRINEHYQLLTPTDFEISNYILSNKNEVSLLSIHELSQKLYVSPASIVRLSKKIGFSGFSELKYQLKIDSNITKVNTETNVSLLKKDINETFNSMSNQNLDIVVSEIKNAEQIFCFGTDWGERLSIELLTRNFMSSGIFMNIIPSLTEFYWILENIQPNDLIIIVSYSGESKELKRVLTQLKSKNIKILSITPFSDNFLSAQAEYRIYYRSTDLDLCSEPVTQYNFFIGLHLAIDYLFRYYNDYHEL